MSPNYAGLALVIVGLPVAVLTYAITGWQIVFLWWFILVLLAVPFALFGRSRR